MSSQLKTTNYDIINAAVHEILSSGNYSYAIIDIFTNSSKTKFALDSNGLPVDDRKVQSISQTLEYINENGDKVNPTITIDFTDGTSFTSDDILDKFWYSVIGVPIEIKTF
jgi:PDZ domain-containing secreted protein